VGGKVYRGGEREGRSERAKGREERGEEKGWGEGEVGGMEKKERGVELGCKNGESVEEGGKRGLVVGGVGEEGEEGEEGVMRGEGEVEGSGFERMKKGEVTRGRGGV